MTDYQKYMHNLPEFFYNQETEEELAESLKNFSSIDTKNINTSIKPPRGTIYIRDDCDKWIKNRNAFYGWNIKEYKMKSKNIIFVNRENIAKCMFNHYQKTTLGSVLTIIIDGEQNQDVKSYLDTIWNELYFPFSEHKNIDGYLNWMRDLSWINVQNINIVIINEDKFLSKETEAKQFFVPDIEMINTFWEKDALEVYSNEKKIKNLTFYFAM